MRALTTHLCLCGLLLMNPAAAVTCDFYQQTPPMPSSIGIKTLEVGDKFALLAYPAEASQFEQISDEREPNRLNLRSYIWFVNLGLDFKSAELPDRIGLTQTIANQWQERGATGIATTHTMVALMHARLQAKALPHRGPIIANADPILVETLAGFGFEVLTNAPLFRRPDKSNLTIAEALQARDHSQAAEAVVHAKVLIAHGDRAKEVLDYAAKRPDVRLIVLAGEIGDVEPPKRATGESEIQYLLMYADDSSEQTQRSLARFNSKKTRFARFSEFENALFDTAAIEACARRSHASKAYPGLHLHGRRLAQRALVLQAIEQALDLDLDLQGSDAESKQALSLRGVSLSKQFKAP